MKNKVFFFFLFFVFSGIWPLLSVCLGILGRPKKYYFLGI